MTYDHWKTTEPDVLEARPIEEPTEEDMTQQARPMPTVHTPDACGDIESQHAQHRNAAVYSTVKTGGPNWLCRECEDKGVQQFEAAIGDSPYETRQATCEHCPTCEVCDERLHEQGGHHLLDPAVGIRWCFLACFQEAIDSCVNAKARAGLLAYVYGEFYDRCIEEAVGELPPDVAEIDERLREMLCQALIGAQRR
jgi:hypothetical protein